MMSHLPARMAGVGLCAALAWTMLAPLARADEASAAPATEARQQAHAEPAKQLFRGQVVRLRDALEERGIRTSDEMESHVVLETPDRELIPILADWRGRAFYQDERLRNRDVELVGFRRPGLPYLQVLMVFTFDDQKQRQYTDYWCDVCSIPMYEIKPCECCQGETRLRFQKRELPEYIQGTDDSAKPPTKTSPQP